MGGGVGCWVFDSNFTINESKHCGICVHVCVLVWITTPHPTLATTQGTSATKQLSVAMVTGNNIVVASSKAVMKCEDHFGHSAQALCC